MLWGFFKKVVIADRLAMVVDRTFGHTAESSSLALFIGAVFYSFQIYCDFSGYSDIALGAAKVMNVRLMENFDQPYLCAQHHQLLEPLAHIAFQLVSRLPVHTAGR